MSLKSLSDYTFYSRYSHYLPENKRRETWSEAVKRVYDMHRQFYAEQIEKHPELVEEIDFVESQQRKKRILAAQRTLQFGGAPIFKHNVRLYNCSATHIDRPRVFQEAMYVLLCGCGVGFSVQKCHIEKLPNLVKRGSSEKTHVIEDSIEGWADAVGVLLSSYFDTDSEFSQYRKKKVIFDYSQIRPKGAMVAGQFLAPGPEGLFNSLQKIESLLETRVNSVEFKTDDWANKLRPINCYDIIMHIGDAVLSGGVRRSATLCLFSQDDTEMATAKTGDWFIKNPQRGRSNNSAALIKGKVSKEQFADLMKSTKEFGEPGFVWLNDEDICYNPCVEIALYPKTEDGRSGWEFCNLSEINGRYCDTEEKFLQCCRAAAIVGTLQAGYSNFKYLTPETKEIVEREALLGVSITGIMDNPEILLSEKIQRKGAQEVKKTNEKIATLLGINQSARTCCTKPAGSTSCILGTSSGIHPHHARRYIRRVQANKTEFCLQEFERQNSIAVEESVWSTNKTDKVISFLCEVPSGAITKNQTSAIDLLKNVLKSQQNWVEYGTNVDKCVKPYIRHNISNTITVKDDEWQDVENFIFDNQKWFAGISLLPASGDLDYTQAPFSTVLSPNEIVKEYGDAAVFASGLIVDGLKAFENLWKACDALNGYGEKLASLEDMQKPEYPSNRSNKALAEYFISKEAYDSWFNKYDWIRRAKQFATRYFNGDVRKTTHCLKHVHLWKVWCDLKREYKEIDWESTIEERAQYVDADTLAAQACSGGACEII
jgi:ribonucleoside-triphosphate reductase (thioredoxin)